MITTLQLATAERRNLNPQNPQNPIPTSNGERPRQSEQGLQPGQRHCDLERGGPSFERVPALESSSTSKPLGTSSGASSSKTASASSSSAASSSNSASASASSEASLISPSAPHLSPSANAPLSSIADALPTPDANLGVNLGAGVPDLNTGVGNGSTDLGNGFGNNLGGIGNVSFERPSVNTLLN